MQHTLHACCQSSQPCCQGRCITLLALLALHAAFITIHSSDTTYAYDANGTLTSGGGRSYAWNADNLPLSITGADGVSESYAYDAEGARVKQTRGSATPPSIGGLLEISGSVTKSSYSFSGQTIAVRENSTNAVR
ncbi:MAG: hypothetical protein KatS3mg057_1037 [Herpetosiphonaceae bacterium]|nr:MAG: hypothetical protein KatS3mg057_1037 [Herpetosiphonaceae bacterium]